MHDGIYLLAGIGYSYNEIISNDNINNSFTGLNLSTSAGYWAFNAFSFEIGSIINYNYNDNFSISNITETSPGVYEKIDNYNMTMHEWGSIFYFGTMARWPFIRPSNNLNLFIRIFNGAGKTVYWIQPKADQVNDFKLPKDSRVTSDGILLGFSIINFFNEFNDKPIWFIEITTTIQMYYESLIIQSDGVLPEIISRNDNTNNIHKVQITLNAGIKFF